MLSSLVTFPLHIYFSSHFFIVYFFPSIFIFYHHLICSLLSYVPSCLHVLIFITFKDPKKKPAGLSQKILYYRFPRKHKSIPTNPLFEHILIGAQNILDGKFFNLLVFGMSCTHHTANNPICELQNHRMKETSRWKKPLWINKSNL